MSTDREIVGEIGTRLRAYRLQKNLTLREVAAQAGLHFKTVENAEAGRDPRLSTVVGILRALGRLDALDGFLPPPGLSPLQLVRLRGKPRQRARKAKDG